MRLSELIRRFWQRIGNVPAVLNAAGIEPMAFDAKYGGDHIYGDEAEKFLADLANPSAPQAGPPAASATPATQTNAEVLRRLEQFVAENRRTSHSDNLGEGVHLMGAVPGNDPGFKLEEKGPWNFRAIGARVEWRRG